MNSPQPAADASAQIQKRRRLLLALALVTIASLAACSTGPESGEVAAKYTEQTARSIIEGSWKIAGSIIFAAFIRGFMNK